MASQPCGRQGVKYEQYIQLTFVALLVHARVHVRGQLAIIVVYSHSHCPALLINGWQSKKQQLHSVAALMYQCTYVQLGIPLCSL